MRGLVLAGVLLAASIGTVQAEDRKCIREMMELTAGNMTAAKRLCDPKNFVTDPNEYGWVCYDGGRSVVREKGEGAKQKRDALYCD
jgi:hypothetical protein